MRFITRMILPLAAVLGLALPAAAQEFPERGTAPVVDAANIIDDATEAALTQKLDQFEEANQRLGLARARAVVGYLVSHGISATRLEAVVSKGETQPLVVTQGRERKNRRTVTEVTGFVQDNPMILDGKYAQVVYRGYVESAIAPTGLTGVDFAGGSSGGE